MNDRLTMLNNLRDHINARADAQGWRKADGRLSKRGNDDAIEFLIGAAAVIDAIGLGDTHGLTGVAFLASVRGADGFMEG